MTAGARATLEFIPFICKLITTDGILANVYTHTIVWGKKAEINFVKYDLQFHSVDVCAFDGLQKWCVECVATSCHAVVTEHVFIINLVALTLTNLITKCQTCVMICIKSTIIFTSLLQSMFIRFKLAFDISARIQSQRTILMKYSNFCFRSFTWCSTEIEMLNVFVCVLYVHECVESKARWFFNAFSVRIPCHSVCVMSEYVAASIINGTTSKSPSRKRLYARS